jgi:hypothetical protein
VYVCTYVFNMCMRNYSKSNYVQINRIRLVCYSLIGEDIWKKMQYIRDMRKRLQKNVDTQKSGVSTADVYRPTLWWYDMVSFLDVDTSEQETTDNLPQVRTVLHVQFRNNICLA